MKKIMLAAVAVSALVLAGCGGASQEDVQTSNLAACLTDNGVKMYGANTCPHCLDQKKTFGSAFQSIEYVECRQNPTACQQAGIEGYPTWINAAGERLMGNRPLEELAGFGGCEAAYASTGVVSEEIAK